VFTAVFVCFQNEAVLSIVGCRVVFDEALFVEYDELILLSACHAEDRDGKNNPFPCEVTDFMKRQHNISVLIVHSELVCLIGNGVVIQIKTTAQDSVMAQTAHKYLSHIFTFQMLFY